MWKLAVSSQHWGSVRQAITHLHGPEEVVISVTTRTEGTEGTVDLSLEDG